MNVPAWVPVTRKFADVEDENTNALVLSVTDPACTVMSNTAVCALPRVTMTGFDWIPETIVVALRVESTVSGACTVPLLLVTANLAVSPLVGVNCTDRIPMLLGVIEKLPVVPALM